MMQNGVLRNPGTHTYGTYTHLCTSHMCTGNWGHIRMLQRKLNCKTTFTPSKIDCDITNIINSFSAKLLSLCVNAPKRPVTTGHVPHQKRNRVKIPCAVAIAINSLWSQDILVLWQQLVVFTLNFSILKKGTAKIKE